jgi:hypothetical protein
MHTWHVKALPTSFLPSLRAKVFPLPAPPPPGISTFGAGDRHSHGLGRAPPRAGGGKPIPGPERTRRRGGCSTALCSWAMFLPSMARRSFTVVPYNFVKGPQRQKKKYMLHRKDAILLVLICTCLDHTKFPDGTDL